MSTRARFISLLLAFVSWSCVAADESLPDNCAILPLSQGPALILQCSRPAPKDVSDYWAPSSSQVIAIEKLLPDLIRKSGLKVKLSGSYRQYMGVVSHGKKIIYLNSFPGSALRPYPSDKQVDWRNKPVIYCDGGDNFWGVEFDPGDNTFHDLKSNGVA